MELYYLCRNPSGDYYVTKDDEELTIEEVVTKLQDKTQRIAELEAGIKRLQVMVQDANIYGTDFILRQLKALLPGRGEL